ncbi:Melanoma-associated antigen G1 [Platysternon megacephalum]|uniref:Melanoma-associated antigen G1 n=1 Tax=Platysternon megacephalum TaxID=55544 RepID=A0A4D9DTU5_9SAUR|nr:Melanoma-associated antigen G1 [Platysternon megacephalum]
MGGRCAGPGPAPARCSRTWGDSRAQVAQEVSKLVPFLLVEDQKKIPIRRAGKMPARWSRSSGWGLHSPLQEFGLQLVEIDTKHHIYILVSNLPRLDGENLKQDDCTAKLDLLTIILSFIFGKGNAAQESNGGACSRGAIPNPSRKRREVFGDVRELVTVEFVQQKYLEYSRMPNTDPAEFEFQWGAQATKETSKIQILHFVAKVRAGGG